MKRAIISACNLSIGYPQTANSKHNELYKDLSFDLYEGELTCLLGLNGAGKSTLLRTLSAMQPALDGGVLLEGKPVEDYTENDLSRILGLVLTDKTSVGGLTVKQLVGLGRYPYTGFFGKLSKEDHEIIQKAMDDVCISHKSDSYVAELSDGERQKAMIAKALAQECPVVFLDEPTAFLDVASRIDIMSLLHNLASKYNKTVLLSTHDMELAFLLADRLWLLSRDKGLKCGVTEDLILNGDVKYFFDKEGVSFDKRTGNFVPERRVEKKVFLQAEEELYHWTANFLKRNNVGITVCSSEADFSLNVLDKNRLSVEQGFDNYCFMSFADLLQWMMTKL